MPIYGNVVMVVVVVVKLTFISVFAPDNGK